MIEFPQDTRFVFTLLRHPAALPALGPGHTAELAREVDPEHFGQLSARQIELEELFEHGTPKAWLNSPARRCFGPALTIAPTAFHDIDWNLTFPGADCPEGNKLHVDFKRLGYSPLKQWLESNSASAVANSAIAATQGLWNFATKRPSRFGPTHIGCFSHYPIVPAVGLLLVGGEGSPYAPIFLTKSVDTTEGFTIALDENGNTLVVHEHRNAA